jgi:asparagine synthase (glutamine-hydrolysing)
MCGIAAIFSYRQNGASVDQEELVRIREAMVKRGPDGAGVWISDDRRVGFAHRRLAIIDLAETGAQPMATASGNVRIVFNGEIYNYRELRQRLARSGYEFRSQSDTEVLLQLYQEYGRDMVRHLRGMYAFAIYDSRRRGLLLARDPYGIKPLYYADNGTTIRVASQVKALLRSGSIDTRPDAAGHVGFFLWGHVPEPYTLYREIRAVPAGTTLWIDAEGRNDARRFFSLTEELAKAEQTRSCWDENETHERLRTALLDTIRHHLVADVPVGMFLSAGIDSSTVTALLKEVSDSGLRTITLGFKEFQDTLLDEVPLAEQVAKRYGTEHCSAWVTKQDFYEERNAILEAMDQPSVDGVNTYFVSKAAKEAGLKVAVSGLGGDELFGGYSSFREIPRIVTTTSAFQAVPLVGKAFRYVSAPILKRFTSVKYAGLLEYGGTYGGAYLLRRGMFMPWELPSVLDKEIVRDGWNELKTLPQLAQTVRDLKNEHLRVTALESTWYMRNQLLRDVDWASMAHSVEVRVPFVDIDLLKAVSPLVACNRVGKLELAATAGLPLPKEILARTKTGFAIPVREWMMGKSDETAAGKSLQGWARFLVAHETRTAEEPTF